MSLTAPTPSLAPDQWIQASKITDSKEPYRYKVYDDFLAPEIYDGLCFEFNDRLSMGLEEVRSGKPYRFVRNNSTAPAGHLSYDMYVLRAPPAVHWPVSIFYSRALYGFFRDEFDRNFTPDVVSSLQHHKTGSRSGFIHNDYLNCNLTRRLLENGLSPVPDSADNGMVKQDGTSKVITVGRAVGVIYYLNNPPWREGDGGETGVYEDLHSDPIAKIPPINNRALAFEVSPRSYHSFLKNHLNPRNSIVFWYHGELDELAARWNQPPTFIPARE